MKCEVCGEVGATVQLTQVVDGEVKKWQLCETCASQEGFNVQEPISLTDILFGMGGEPDSVSDGEKVCSTCHLQRSDFTKTSRLGCQECYSLFSEELAPLLNAMHKGDRHLGKVPRCEQVSAEIAALQSDLQDAINDQHFEEAARLRDEIQNLSPDDVSAHVRSEEEVDEA
jgi:protein arginine kinase activator